MPPLRIMMLGLRGFPKVQGGVETHVQHLSLHLINLGCQVSVVVRSPYLPNEVGIEWNGIQFHRIWAPLSNSKGLEALAHTFLGVCFAALKRPDVLHIHAIGPSLMIPLARLFGLKVVMTHHGPDYDRQKWGRVGKGILKLGERFGVNWAHERIAISQVIRNLVKKKYGKGSVVIPNGVELPVLPTTTVALSVFGLSPEKYVLTVGRLVPEKRHLDLISAFVMADLPEWKLVIVGDSKSPDGYANSILDTIKENSNIIATGLQSGQYLQELYANAGLFVLPSSHEGLPIALLEALSYGLTVLASDIPANLEIGLPEQNYFRLGDMEMLSRRLREFSCATPTAEVKNDLRNFVSRQYDWGEIARNTLQVYLNVLNKAPYSVFNIK